MTSHLDFFVFQIRAHSEVLGVGTPAWGFGEGTVEHARVGEEGKGLPPGTREDLIQVSGAPRQVEVCRGHPPAGRKHFSETLEVE